MKKMIMVALAALMLTACGTRIHLYSRNEFLEKVNLIENSGFEVLDRFGSELPEGWILLDNSPDQVIIDSQIAHSGSKSLKIKKPLTSIQLTSDSFNVDPTCSYYCRCFLKANKNTKEPVTFYFITFDHDSKRINRFSQRVFPTQEWSMVEINTDSLDLNSAFGRIVLSIPDDSDINIWVDDVESYTICNTEKE